SQIGRTGHSSASHTRPPSLWPSLPPALVEQALFDRTNEDALKMQAAHPFLVRAQRLATADEAAARIEFVVGKDVRASAAIAFQHAGQQVLRPATPLQGRSRIAFGLKARLRQIEQLVRHYADFLDLIGHPLIGLR